MPTAESGRGEQKREANEPELDEEQLTDLHASVAVAQSGQAPVVPATLNALPPEDIARFEALHAALDDYATTKQGDYFLVVKHPLQSDVLWLSSKRVYNDRRPELLSCLTSSRTLLLEELAHAAREREQTRHQLRETKAQLHKLTQELTAIRIELGLQGVHSKQRASS